MALLKQLTNCPTSSTQAKNKAVYTNPQCLHKQGRQDLQNRLAKNTNKKFAEQSLRTLTKIISYSVRENRGSILRKLFLTSG